jgi:hypothetical protein
MIEEIKRKVLDILSVLDDVKKLPNFIYITMEFVEKQKTLKGIEKKNMVICVIKDIVKDANLSDEQKIYCNTMIESGLVDNMIDLVVDAASGKIEINMEDAIYGGTKCLAANCIACIKTKNL